MSSDVCVCVATELIFGQNFHQILRSREGRQPKLLAQDIQTSGISCIEKGISKTKISSDYLPGARLATGRELEQVAQRQSGAWDEEVALLGGTDHCPSVSATLVIVPYTENIM